MNKANRKNADSQDNIINRTNFSINYTALPMIDTEKLIKFIDQNEQQVTIEPKNAIVTFLTKTRIRKGTEHTNYAKKGCISWMRRI